MSTSVGDRLRDPAMVACLSDAFTRDGYVRLGHLLRSDRLLTVRGEVEMLKGYAQRRSFTMSGSGTPRRLSTLGGSAIATLSQEIVGDCRAGR